jgi:hypothetical protein
MYRPQLDVSSRHLCSSSIPATRAKDTVLQSSTQTDILSHLALKAAQLGNQPLYFPVPSGPHAVLQRVHARSGLTLYSARPRLFLPFVLVEDDD